MDELLQQVLAHLRGMWHRRWIGLAAAWIAAIVCVVVAYRIPERFEASARVYVDTQSLLRPVMAGLAIQPNLDQQVALMSRTLISRPNVEKLVRMADLDLRDHDQRRARGADRQPDEDAPARRQRVDEPLRDLLSRRRYPTRRRRSSQSLLTIFVESSLGDKRQDTRAAVKFLDEQIKRYEESLQAAENRLKEFKLKYMGVPGQGGQDFFSRIAKLSDDIEAARLELRSAEESRDAYKRDLAGEAPTFLPERRGASAPVAVPEIDARIAAQKTKLDELLRTYTDQHPDVVGTRRVIEELEAQRKQEVEALQKAASASGPPPEPAPSAIPCSSRCAYRSPTRRRTSRRSARGSAR